MQWQCSQSANCFFISTLNSDSLGVIVVVIETRKGELGSSVQHMLRAMRKHITFCTISAPLTSLTLLTVLFRLQLSFMYIQVSAQSVFSWQCLSFLRIGLHPFICTAMEPYGHPYHRTYWSMGFVRSLPWHTTHTRKLLNCKGFTLFNHYSIPSAYPLSGTKYTIHRYLMKKIIRERKRIAKSSIHMHKHTKYVL